MTHESVRKRIIPESFFSIPDDGARVPGDYLERDTRARISPQSGDDAQRHNNFGVEGCGEEELLPPITMRAIINKRVLSTSTTFLSLYTHGHFDFPCLVGTLLFDDTCRVPSFTKHDHRSGNRP